MGIEYEAKALHVDPDAVREALDRRGARLITPRRLMRRHVYDVVAGDGSQWIRLRDQGEQVSLTYKRIRHDGVDGTDEIEIEVEEFDQAHRFLTAIGFTAKAYQENYRTSYELDGVQVEIDEWPRLDPYVEIEGESVAAVHRVAALLGWRPAELTSVNTMQLYADAGINLNDVPQLRFE